jgi:hypothetical protein
MLSFLTKLIIITLYWFNSSSIISANYVRPRSLSTITKYPTKHPTNKHPTSHVPTLRFTTYSPSKKPTLKNPTKRPTTNPSGAPSLSPTTNPSRAPSLSPSTSPSLSPRCQQTFTSDSNPITVINGDYTSPTNGVTNMQCKSVPITVLTGIAQIVNVKFVLNNAVLSVTTVKFVMGNITVTLITNAVPVVTTTTTFTFQDNALYDQLYWAGSSAGSAPPCPSGGCLFKPYHGVEASGTFIQFNGVYATSPAQLCVGSTGGSSGSLDWFSVTIEYYGGCD